MTEYERSGERKEKQPLNEEQSRLVHLAYERLMVWRQGCREMQERARTARKIFLLQDPMQDPPGTPAEKRTLQLQTLKSTINSCIADQMDNMPEIKLLPERPELGETADVLEDVMRFVLEQNRFDSFQRRRAEDFFVTGSAVTQIVWDSDMNGGEGDIAVLRWPMEAFLWDPCAEDIQEGRAVIKVSWHPLDWFKSRFPDKAKYIAPEDSRYGNIGQPEGWETLTGDEDRAMLMEYWWREYDLHSRRHQVHVALLAGGALLDMQKNVYAHGQYPFVVDAFSHIDGMPVGEGMVMELAPMMRYINRYAHYIDENLRMSAKIRMLVRKNANIDVEALADWNENLISGDAIDEESVRWLQSKPLSHMAANQMLQFQVDIKQDSGQNQFTRGETIGGVTAASAINALQEAGSKISRMRTDTLNAGFREIAEQILWLVSQFYTREKTRMITGDDGSRYAASLDAAVLMGDIPMLDGSEKELPEGMRRSLRRKLAEKRRIRWSRPLPAPPYVVQILVQKRNPLRIQAQNELFLRVFELAKQEGIPFSLESLFELMDVDGKDRVRRALRQEAEREAMLQALSQRVEQMQREEEEVAQLAEDNRKLEEETVELRRLTGTTI